MPHVTTPAAVTVSTAVAGEAQNELARIALHSQRQRLVALFGGLDDDAWAAQSRCVAWSVHEVVRHLCDATLKSTALLRGATPKELGADHFDPRTTPVEWLERSVDETPHETSVVFENASADLLEEVDRHIRDGSGAEVPFLYGRVPWSIVVLHTFFDAWIHERDIVCPLRRQHDSPALESRAAAAYGVTMGCVPVVLEGAPLDETIVLTGDGGGVFRLAGRGGKITITVGDNDSDRHGSDVEPLRGSLGEVIDSLMGRGPELTEVLRGPPQRVERLSMMRALLLPAS